MQGLLSGWFCQGVFCLEGFVQGGFCPFLLLSEYICMLQQKVKHHFKFMFHMHDKKCISVTSHAFDLLRPVTTVTPSQTPLPLDRDVLYGRTLGSCRS